MRYSASIFNCILQEIFFGNKLSNYSGTDAPCQITWTNKIDLEDVTGILIVVVGTQSIESSPNT